MSFKSSQMNWKEIIQTIFYVMGIIFFIIVIAAAFIFIRRTVQTSNVIKKVLTSTEVEDLIMKVKDGVVPLLDRISRR